MQWRPPSDRQAFLARMGGLTRSVQLSRTLREALLAGVPSVLWHVWLLVATQTSGLSATCKRPFGVFRALPEQSVMHILAFAYTVQTHLLRATQLMISPSVSRLSAALHAFENVESLELCFTSIVKHMFLPSLTCSTPLTRPQERLLLSSGVDMDRNWIHAKAEYALKAWQRSTISLSRSWPRLVRMLCARRSLLKATSRFGRPAHDAVLHETRVAVLLPGWGDGPDYQDHLRVSRRAAESMDPYSYSRLRTQEGRSMAALWAVLNILPVDIQYERMAMGLWEHQPVLQEYTTLLPTYDVNSALRSTQNRANKQGGFNPRLAFRLARLVYPTFKLERPRTVPENRQHLPTERETLPSRPQLW